MPLAEKVHQREVYPSMEGRSRLRQVLASLIGSACVFAGFFLLVYFSTTPVARYGATLSWRSVRGTLVSATYDGGRCVVSYTYTVDLMSYEGNRTRTLGQDRRAAARRFCESINATTDVEVWYDVGAPQDSALRVTFISDFWLAFNLLDSLALVALGGALFLWAIQTFTPLLIASCAHAALCFVTAVPVSIIRLSRAHVAATMPLIVGITCGAVALACAYQLGCGARSSGSQALRSRSLDGLWFSSGDVVP